MVLAVDNNIKIASFALRLIGYFPSEGGENDSGLVGYVTPVPYLFSVEGCVEHDKTSKEKGQRWGFLYPLESGMTCGLTFFIYLYFHILPIIFRCVMRCHHTVRRKNTGKLHAGGTLSAIHSARTIRKCRGRMM